MNKINDFMMIKEASEFLGVTENTLRNWEKNKKIRVYRHPFNKYRLYDKNDLIKLLGTVNDHVTTLEYDTDYYKDQIVENEIILNEHYAAKYADEIE